MIIVDEKAILRFFLLIIIPALVGYTMAPIFHDFWDYITDPKPDFLFKPAITKLNMTWVNQYLIPPTNTVGPQIPTLTNGKEVLENITGSEKAFAVHLIERGVPPHDYMYKENRCEFKIIKWCMDK